MSKDFHVKSKKEKALHYYHYKSDQSSFNSSKKFHKYEKDLNQECFTETHTMAGFGVNQAGNVPILVSLRPNVTETIFEDFTCNHNKTLIQLRSEPSGAFPAFPLEVTIRTRGSRIPIVATIPGSQTIESMRAFQVEDFESLSVRFNDEVGQREAAVSVFIQKTFCVCCKSNKTRCSCK
jgi:hypothetical protein